MRVDLSYKTSKFNYSSSPVSGSIHVDDYGATEASDHDRIGHPMSSYCAFAGMPHGEYGDRNNEHDGDRERDVVFVNIHLDRDLEDNVEDCCECQRRGTYQIVVF